MTQFDIFVLETKQIIGIQDYKDSEKRVFLIY